MSFTNNQSTNDDLTTRWNEWKIEYGKTYSTLEDDYIAFQIWKKTDEKINEINARYIAQGKGKCCGHNEYSASPNGAATGLWAPDNNSQSLFESPRDYRGPQF